MSLDQVLSYLADVAQLGVKEFYFTGGEPFINPDLPKMLEATLRIGPATVLTNATLFTNGLVEELADMRNASKYSLEIRVSIDGFSPETNDPIRGPGTFKRAMRGIKLLLDGGFLPIITAMRSWPMDEDEAQLCGFKNSLIAVGYRYPRIKLLPSLKIGQEALRDHGYSKHDYITESMMVGYDTSQLMCSNSRILSVRGVHVCPILVDQPDSILGKRLCNAKPVFRLSHQACMTCYRYGTLCSNPSSAAPSFEKMRLSRPSRERSYSE
jgi:MoaA/NifB/PqqE/SkfB family radical SAM enzyme